jgi:methylmalonyl-CoA/ethylmalonyl-CoA epimerase
LIDHLAIAIKDLDEGVRWYCDYLGFKLVDAVRRLVNYLDEFGPAVQHIALRVPDLSAALAAFPLRIRSMDTPIIEGNGIRRAFLTRAPGSGGFPDIEETR